MSASVIDFIAADAQKRPPRGAVFGVAAALIGVCTAAALLLRADYGELQSPAFLAPVLGLMAALASAVWATLGNPSGRAWRVAWICVTAGLLLTLCRDGMPLGEHYADLPTFWRAAGACFAKGLGTSIVASLVLTAAARRWRPLPSRRWRLAMAATSALAGFAMLSLHCGSANLGHIVAGHWGQAVPIALWSVFWQRWVATRMLTTTLGDTATRLANPGRLGDS